MALQGFDESYYLGVKLTSLQATYPEWVGKTTAQLKTTLASLGFTPEQHCLKFGFAEKLGPNAYFNAEEYILAKATSLFNAGGYLSIAAAKAAFVAAVPGDPYTHYLNFGGTEAINPSNAFDSSSYIVSKLAQLKVLDPVKYAATTVADVAKAIADAGFTPLTHYLQIGKTEGIAVTVVPAAEKVTAESVNSTSGQTFTLTSSIDTVTGTAGNDTILGDKDSAGAADQINGGAGSDTLKIYGAGVKGVLTSVENVYLNAPTAGMSVATDAGVTSLEIDSLTAGGLDFTVTTGQALTLSNFANAAALTVNFKGNTPTSQTLTVNKVGSATLMGTVDFHGTALTTLDLVGKTAASNLTLANTGGKLATINFTGDQAVKLTTALTTITTINAADATGALNIDGIGASTLAFTGGAGNDRINMGATLLANDKIDGGAGTGDTIAFGTAGGATLTTAAAVGIKNFEKFEASGVASGTYDLDTIATLNTLTAIDISATTSATVNNINAASVGAIGITSNDVATLVFTGKDFVAGGTSDTAKITLDNSVTKAADGIDVTTSLTFANADVINIVTKSDGTAAKTIASGNGHSVTALTATDLDKLTVTGDESLTITTAAGTLASEIDASGLTGKAAISVNTSAAAVVTELIKATANVDTINTSNVATLTTTLYTGGGSDVLVLNGAATAVNTLKFTTTTLNAGDLKAGDAMTIDVTTNAAVGTVVRLDFNAATEALFKVGGVNLSTTVANQNVVGTLGATTNVASIATTADIHTIQFDLNGDAVYTAASDAQITITGVGAGVDTLVYDAANDYFTFTVV